LRPKPLVFGHDAAWRCWLVAEHTPMDLRDRDHGHQLQGHSHQRSGRGNPTQCASVGHSSARWCGLRMECTTHLLEKRAGTGCACILCDPALCRCRPESIEFCSVVDAPNEKCLPPIIWRSSSSFVWCASVPQLFDKSNAAREWIQLCAEFTDVSVCYLDESPESAQRTTSSD
jgi:hypothetical protein